MAAAAAFLSVPATAQTAADGDTINLTGTS
jgi:hypothetical protein